MKPNRLSDLYSAPPSLHLAVALACSTTASFALEWDPNPAAGVQPADGNWNLSEANWTGDGGATNTTWVSVGPDNDATPFRETAVFGGPDGTYVVNVNESFISGPLSFQSDGYTLTGESLTINLGSSDSNVFLAAGKSAALGSGLKIRTYSGRIGQPSATDSGTFNVESGGTYEARGTASISLDGLGTTLNVFGLVDTVTGQLNLGATGNNAASPGTPITNVTINVKNGGTLDSDGNNTQIGLANLANVDPSDITGKIVVESGGSAALAEVRVGQYGTGFLEIQDGGTVNAGAIVLGNGGSAVGQLDLAGTLTANSINLNKPNSVANFDGGMLIARAAEPNGLIYGAGGTLNIRDNGITIDTNGFDIVVNRGLTHSSIDGDAAIDGGLVKVGAGKLTLTEDSTFTGFTDVLEGILEVGNGGTKGTISDGALNDGTLMYNRSDDVVISVSSEGAGSLIHAGAGKLTLAAEALYTGSTTVTTGILELDDGNAIDDGSRLTIEGNGTVELTQNETVNELFFGIAPQVPGDWGSPASSATNKDARFSGTGILTVLSGAAPTVQVWDTDVASGFQPLNGNWNSTEAFWSGDGINLAAWNPALPTVFGGVDTTATITVTEDLAPGAIEFTKSGFTLVGDDPARKLTLGAPQLTLGDGTSNSIGSNLTLTRAAPLRIGETASNASGSLAILSGATVETVGDETTPAGGDLNIEGINTAVSVSGTLQVSSGLGRINLGSNQAAGTDVSLTIESGGQVLTETGSESGSNNLIQVGLALSSIADPGNVKGTLTVKDGGLLRVGTTADRTIRLGQYGTGTLNIEANGLVQCANVALGNGGSGTGFLNLSGTIETDTLNLAKPNSRAYFNGGILKVVGSTPELITGPNNSTTGLAYVRNGGLTVDTNGTDKSIIKPLRHSTIVDDAAIDGGLTKIGAGKLTLNQGNTYTGATKVSGGTLNLDNGNAIPDANSLVINTGGVVELTQNETVDTLFYGSSPQPAGTYGSTASTATNKDDSRFAGTGVLTVQSEGSSGSPFDAWALASGLDGTSGKENGPTDDPDKDGADNFSEFAFNGDPLNGADNGQIASLIQDASAPTGDELTLIVAVRDGASFASSGSSPNVVETATVDGVVYTIEGSLDLAFPGSDVAFASGPADTAPADAGLPDLAGTDWEYWTFKLVASESLAAEKGFMRANATEAP